MESNHPSGGLLRPAGFEDRMGHQTLPLRGRSRSALDRAGPRSVGRVRAQLRRACLEHEVAGLVLVADQRGRPTTGTSRPCACT